MVEGVEMTDAEFYDRVCGLARFMVNGLIPPALTDASWEMNNLDYARYYSEVVLGRKVGVSLTTLYGIRIRHSADFPEGEIRLVLKEII